MSGTTFRLPAAPLRRFLRDTGVDYPLAALLGGWSVHALKKQLDRDRLDGYRVDQLLIELGSHISLVYPSWLEVPETLVCRAAA